MRGDQINNEPTAIGCLLNCCFAQMLWWVWFLLGLAVGAAGGTGTRGHCWSFVISFLFCVVTGLTGSAPARGAATRQVTSHQQPKVRNHEL